MINQRLRGGMGDKRNLNSFDQQELKKGIYIELEHTNDPRIAREIATDHLSENPHYYSELIAFEKQHQKAHSGQVYDHVKHHFLFHHGLPGNDVNSSPWPKTKVNKEMRWV